MSEKGNSGMRIDLNKIPLRESDMSSYEIMLSESQERMLVVAKKGYEDNVRKTFEKWDLKCEIIGEVTDDPYLDVKYENNQKVKIEAFDLVLGGGAPVYTREAKEPGYLKKTQEYDFSSLSEPEDLQTAFLEVFSSPNIASKNWAYQQYDSMVRTNTVVGPGCDAAVIRIKNFNKAIAAKTDCNGRYVYLNPREGAKIAVAESARNIVCSGGNPLAITNCLNFGNPYKPEMYWTFKEAIAGMNEACRLFNTPVTGGNVSFYNESPDAAVYPTPVIGMVGLINDLSKVTTSYFKNPGDLIFILGEDYEEIGGSEYLKVIHNLVEGNAPKINLKVEKDLHDLLLTLISSGIVKSAHDISEGGVISALAECCIMNEEKQIGAQVNLSVKTREDLSLFSESQSRVIISILPGDKDKFEKLVESYSTPVYYAGITGGENLRINKSIDIALQKLSDIYFNIISEKMNEQV